MALRKRKFNESLHPRNPHSGEFVEKGKAFSLAADVMKALSTRRAGMTRKITAAERRQGSLQPTQGGEKLKAMTSGGILLTSPSTRRAAPSGPVAASELKAGDHVRLSGIDLHGKPMKLNGFVQGAPGTVRNRRTQEDFLAVQMAETPSGGGANWRGTVYVPKTAKAERTVPSPDVARLAGDNSFAQRVSDDIGARRGGDLSDSAQRALKRLAAGEQPAYPTATRVELERAGVIDARGVLTDRGRERARGMGLDVAQPATGPDPAAVARMAKMAGVQPPTREQLAGEARAAVSRATPAQSGPNVRAGDLNNSHVGQSVRFMVPDRFGRAERDKTYEGMITRVEPESDHISVNLVGTKGAIWVPRDTQLTVTAERPDTPEMKRLVRAMEVERKAYAAYAAAKAKRLESDRNNLQSDAEYAASGYHEVAQRDLNDAIKALDTPRVERETGGMTPAATEIANVDTAVADGKMSPSMGANMLRSMGGARQGADRDAMLAAANRHQQVADAELARNFVDRATGGKADAPAVKPITKILTDLADDFERDHPETMKQTGSWSGPRPAVAPSLRRTAEQFEAGEIDRTEVQRRLNAMSTAVPAGGTPHTRLRETFRTVGKTPVRAQKVAPAVPAGDGAANPAPYASLKRPTLLRLAKAKGITLRRGEPDDSIRQKIADYDAGKMVKLTPAEAAGVLGTPQPAPVRLPGPSVTPGGVAGDARLQAVNSPSVARDMRSMSDVFGEHSALTRVEFDAMPETERERVLADLRKVRDSKETKSYTIPSNRSTYGSTVRGLKPADHVEGARAKLRELTYVAPAPVDNSIVGRSARLKAGDTSALGGLTIAEMNEVSREAGFGGMPSNWPRDKVSAYLVNNALMGDRRPASYRPDDVAAVLPGASREQAAAILAVADAKYGITKADLQKMATAMGGGRLTGDKRNAMRMVAALAPEGNAPDPGQGLDVQIVKLEQKIAAKRQAVEAAMRKRKDTGSRIQSSIESQRRDELADLQRDLMNLQQQRREASTPKA